MQRVKSKHLFNYQLSGELHPSIAALTEKWMAGMLADPDAKAAWDRINSDDPNVDDQEAVDQLRSKIPFTTQYLTTAFKDAIDQCIHTEFKVPVRDGNVFEVPVLVHTPKNIAESKMNACVIYAHGGGVISGSAEMAKGLVSRMALETGVVFFNVDYRLAPETKYPNNALDFYCSVKHIKENGDAFGIDPARIVIAGDSGGGYICFASMVLMAQKNDTDLVKLAIPGVAMISDNCFSDPAAMTREEREYAYLMRRNWRCIADDIDKQWNDPLLFPAKASDETIAKMPPTMIWEMEFDMFITENSRMANRMRRLGRLLEFRVQPGMNHGGARLPDGEGFPLYVRDYKLALQQYLL